MDLYHSSDNYRDKVERAWEKHQYAYNFHIYDAMQEAMKQAEQEMKELEQYLDETRIDPKRANRKD